MTAKPFLLYGATGYTGTLVAEACAARGINNVVLGGRGDGVRALADRLHLKHVIASLDDDKALDSALAGMGAVLHCAGPFSRTSRAMVNACVRNRVHYLDITGEITVFEAIAARDDEAKKAGVVLLPGAGFDVVPSDCMAAHVKKRLPTATKLQLCVAAGGSLSHGTAATMVEHLASGGAVRKRGVIVSERAGKRTRDFDLGNGKVRTGASMPWGDVSTAFYSTKIPDIEVYFPLAKRARAALAMAPFVLPLMNVKAIKNAVQSRIPQGGLDESARNQERSMSVIVADASDDAGNRSISRLTTTNGYTLTVETSIRAVQRVLAGGVPAGFQTPSLAFGPDFILEAPSTTRVDVS